MLIVGHVFEKVKIYLEEQGYEPEELFDVVTEYEFGRLRVELEGYYNYVFKHINGSCKLMCHEWYDYIGVFKDDIACVKHKNKWNFMYSNGEFINDTWFDLVCPFDNGLAKVKLVNRYNFINTQGKIISGVWFEDTETFYNGYCAVKRENKWNFIDGTGRILSALWFDDVEDFEYFFGFEKTLQAEVKLDSKWNIININGRLCLEEWVDYIGVYSCGHIMVNRDGKFNYVNNDYKYISGLWFDYVTPFINGISEVMIGNKFNFIKTDGNLLQGVWFDDVKTYFPFHQSSFAEVKFNNEKRWLHRNGKMYDNKYLVKWLSFVETCKDYGSACFWWWFADV